jgi:hypothetical protein
MTDFQASDELPEGAAAVVDASPTGQDGTPGQDTSSAHDASPASNAADAAAESRDSEADRIAELLGDRGPLVFEHEPEALSEFDDAPLTTGPVRRFLYRVAGVFPGDIVTWPDAIAYGAIGALLCVYFLYAGTGLALFFDSFGGGHHAPAVTAGLIGAAAMLALVVVFFDRFLVTRSNGRKEPLPAPVPGEEDATARAIGTALTHPLGRRRVLPFLGRLAITLVVAALVTQSFDNRAFTSQIEGQRSKDVSATLGQLARDPDGAIAAKRRDIAAKTRLQNRVARHERWLEGRISHWERMATADSRGNDPSGLPGCERYCRQDLANAENARRQLRAYRAAHAGEVAAAARQVSADNAAIARLSGEQARAAADDTGGFGDIVVLAHYLTDPEHRSALLFYALLTLLLIGADCLAICIKYACHGSRYERRQAIRELLIDWQTVVAKQEAVNRRLTSHARQAVVVELARDLQRQAVELLRSEPRLVARVAGQLRGLVLDHLGVTPPRPKLQVVPGGENGTAGGGRSDRRRAGGSTPPPSNGSAPDPPDEADAAGDAPPREEREPQRPPVLRQYYGGTFWRRSHDTLLERGARLYGEEAWDLEGELPTRTGSAHGRTWLAHLANDPSDRVVIKVLPMPRGRDQVSERLRSYGRIELQRAVQLPEHAHIMRVVDSYRDPRADYVWIATRYFPEGSLEDFYTDRERKQRPLRQIVAILEQIADGLVAAANSSVGDIVHLDLKPSNLLVEHVTWILEPTPAYDVPVVRITDWVLSKIVQHVDSELSASPAGSPGYSSPEALSGGHAANPRSPLFSVGAIGWRLITGEIIYSDEWSVRPATETIRACIERRGERDRPLDHIRYWAPNLPPRVAELIDRLLSPDPDARAPHGAKDPRTWLLEQLQEIRADLRDRARRAAARGEDGEIWVGPAERPPYVDEERAQALEDFRRQVASFGGAGRSNRGPSSGREPSDASRPRGAGVQEDDERDRRGLPAPPSADDTLGPGRQPRLGP